MPVGRFCDGGSEGIEIESILKYFVKCILFFPPSLNVALCILLLLGRLWGRDLSKVLKRESSVPLERDGTMSSDGRFLSFVNASLLL